MEARQPPGVPRYRSVLRSVGVVAAADVLQLHAVPQVVVPAPGDGLAIVPVRAMIHKPAGVAYGQIANNEDLVFRFTDLAGPMVGAIVEAQGFLDQAGAMSRVLAFAGEIRPVGNAPIVITIRNGAIAAGDSPLAFEIKYDVMHLSPVLDI